MSHVPARLQRAVRERAAERCEYCGLAQEGQEGFFHIDHVLPVVAGGPTLIENLALACVTCSLRKSWRQSARDPHTSEEVPLYNPRVDRFYEHFRWEGATMLALTATGRATIEALALNRPQLVQIREESRLLGRHPPPGDWPKTD
jgi:hypothetical protein